jgi:hypothetical protein
VAAARVAIGHPEFGDGGALVHPARRATTRAVGAPAATVNNPADSRAGSHMTVSSRRAEAVPTAFSG